MSADSMSGRIAAAITGRTKTVILAVLLLTALMGYGAYSLERSTNINEFQSDSLEAEALTQIEESYGTDDNTTTVQIVLKSDGENRLSRDAMLETMQLQSSFREDKMINGTLTERPFQGLPNVVATTAIRQEQARLGRTSANLSDQLNRTRSLQQRYLRLNQSFEQGEINRSVYRTRSAEIEAGFTRVEENAAANLTDEQFQSFEPRIRNVRSLTAEIAAVQVQFRAGEIDNQTKNQRIAELEGELAAQYEAIRTDVLADAFDSLLVPPGEEPTQAQQQEKLEEMSDEEVEQLVERLLGEDGQRGVLVFVPRYFEPGETSTNATMFFVSQSGQAGMSGPQGQTDDAIVDSQLAMQGLVQERFADGGFVFGSGIISDETDRSFDDSLVIVIPLALLFVVGTLAVAYRDLFDIILGTLGIGVVLVWTFGFMGWAGIAFNQIFISVPVLLIGLSIDYAIHVFMRQREDRMDDGTSSRRSMNTALAGLAIALTWVTLAAMIGFLANLISPLPPIQDFGLVSAFGVFAALVVFGSFLPALKIELDELLEGFGLNREKRAFGTGGGAISELLSAGETLASRAPLIVVILTVLVTGAAVAGATQVDTSFNQEDFLADDPPEFVKDVPVIGPGEYTIKSNLQFVNENFVRQDTQSQILLRAGSSGVADDDVLNEVKAAQEEAARTKDNGNDAHPAITKLSNGQADVQSPLTVMQSVAAENDQFAQSFAAADTDDDGVPDENVQQLYDELYEVAPERASSVIARNDEGGYTSARLVFTVEGTATSGEVTGDTRAVAEEFDGRDAVATGQLIVFNIIEQGLLDTVRQGLIITLISVAVFLIVAYRLLAGSASLGFAMILPIAFSVAWILGTMYLLDIPFNAITGTITSLTIGLGIAYNIHMGERYRLELSRGFDARESLYRAVTGTGGALLGSAGTTIGSFGVLTFAILPVLQQFGIVTGLTIAYAFFSSVLVLPSILLLWTKYAGPSETIPADMSAVLVSLGQGQDSPSAPDGGGRQLSNAGETPGGQSSTTPDADTASSADVDDDAEPGDADPAPASSVDFGDEAGSSADTDDEASTDEET